MIELPWRQLLIHGPIAHCRLTGDLALALTGVLVHNCHRGTQSSCNLPVEVSRQHIKHFVPTIQTHTSTATPGQRRACKDLQRHTHWTPQSPHYTHLYSNTHTHTSCKQAHGRHSLNLVDDVRLTHIEHLIFVRVCAGVKAPLRHLPTFTTLICTAHLKDRLNNIGLRGFQDMGATCKLKQSASISFLHRMNK